MQVREEDTEGGRVQHSALGAVCGRRRRLDLEYPNNERPSEWMKLCLVPTFADSPEHRLHHPVQVELQIMARLSHPNIVRVYGGCLTPPNIFVVTELMAGDLSDRIHNAAGSAEAAVPMDLRQALTTALDIIKGLVSAIISCSSRLNAMRA